MASYKERMLDGLETDLVSMGRTGKLPEDPASELVKVLAAALHEYTVILATLKTEAEDPEKAKAREAAEAEARQQITQAEEDLKAWKAEAAEAEAAKIREAAADPTSDLVAVLASSRQAREAAEAEAEDLTGKVKAEAEAVLADLAKATSDLEAQAGKAGKAKAKEQIGSSTPTGDTTKTEEKILSEEYWHIGPHRDGKSDLLTGEEKGKYTGYFLLRTSDRALFFLPKGSAYNGAPLGKYTELVKGKYNFIGNMVDTKATRSLTGIVRYCHEWINKADLDNEGQEHTLRINDRAVADNLVKNAGGTVFLTRPDQKILDLILVPAAPDPAPDPAKGKGKGKGK